MATNLDCIGFRVGSDEEFHALAARAFPLAAPIGSSDGHTALRFQDPSGARLVFGVNAEHQIEDMLPSFAAPPEVRLAGIHHPNPETAIADIVDDDGVQTGQLSVDLEERILLRRARQPETLMAGLVALGVNVTVFADANAFAADPASLLVADADPEEERPTTLPDGFAWPVRIAPASFVSYGVWNTGADVEAYARLAGEVVSAELRTVGLGGGRFIAATVRSLFPTTVCLPADEHHLPEPGAVIAGTVYMVGSVELPAPQLTVPAEAEAEPARRRFSVFRRGQ